MRFLMFTRGGDEEIGVRTTHGLVPLRSLVQNAPTELNGLLSYGLDAWSHIPDASNDKVLDPNSVRLLPPTRRAGKIICLGLNYENHAAEAHLARPEFPVVFMRTNSSLVAHAQPIIRPSQSVQLDFEGELAVIIGKKARRVSRSHALDCVSGYSVFNDASVRDYQLRTSQWTLGKNFDATGGFGPEFVTAEELPPGAAGLSIETRLNGELVQRGNTADMVFDVATTIEIVTSCMSLEVGDLLVMGTPAGVGATRQPPLWMKPGDVVEVTIEGIGTLANPIADEEKVVQAA